MEWKQASKKDDATIIPDSWIFIHYYEALNTLFRLENSLRVFVYIVLKNHFFDKWCDIQITSDDAEQATIETIAKKRRNQAQDFGYLGYNVNCPVMYLTSGELIRIITSDTYWKYFKSYFPASKQIVEHKLDEIGVIRNSLAHFRPLKSDDVEVIKNNAKHALSGVDYFLEQLGSCFNVVPTNTPDNWYLSISPLRNEWCDLKLYQCEDQTWLELNFTYHSKVISSGPITLKGEYHSHQILNLITPQILEHYGSITKYATCLIERAADTEDYNPEEPSFYKTFYIYFNRDVLSKHYEDIRNDIELLLNDIKSQTELILSDNLARGKLISVARISAKLQQAEKSKFWRIDAKHTLCPNTKESSFPEYWGDSFLLSSMVTTSDQYPWMPTEVSRFSI
jgi:hypothetical protein